MYRNACILHKRKPLFSMDLSKCQVLFEENVETAGVRSVSLGLVLKKKKVRKKQAFLEHLKDKKANFFLDILGYCLSGFLLLY